MPTLLAVDWDTREFRFIIAQLAGAKIDVRAAGNLPLGEQGTADDWGAALAEVIERHKLRRPHLLIGLPRRDIELLNLTTPPAKNDELAGLVANLAVNESSSIGDDAILDFAPLDDDEALPRHVLATALARSVYDRILRDTAGRSQKPRRLVLRSFAAASLFRRLDGNPDDVCLLVSRVGSEANLILVAGQRLMMARAVRLPDGASAAEVNDRLATEITRTTTVAPMEWSELGPVQRVAIFGSAGEYAELSETLAGDRGLEAVTLDPFQQLGVPEELLPDSPSDFAPLLGMLLDEAAGTHAIDFLNPHRPPRSVSRLRIGLGLGGLAAAILLIIAGHLWMTLREINDTNAQLAARMKQLDQTMKQVAVRRQVYTAIAGWQQRDINWLDELRDLSIRFPDARDAVVLRMSLRSAAEGRGEIDFNGLVRDPKIVANLEHLLRDEYHQLSNPGIQQRGAAGDFTSQFRMRMRVVQRDKEAYVSHLPPAPAAEPEEQPAAEPSPRVAAGNPREDRP